MTIRFTATFAKQHKKLSQKLQAKFDERIFMFQTNPYDPLLRNHALNGKYVGYHSINITGDLRALYYKEGNEIIIFGFIGTHSQLYG